MKWDPSRLNCTTVPVSQLNTSYATNADGGPSSRDARFLWLYMIRIHLQHTDSLFATPAYTLQAELCGYSRRDLPKNAHPDRITGAAEIKRP